MTKSRILLVATNQFSIYGYDGLSMNKLASILKINKATIYYHFKDKKSLYQEVILNIIEDNRVKIEQIISNDRLTPKEKFREFLKIKVTSFKTNPQIVTLILREMANFGANLDDNIGEYFDKDLNLLNQLIQSLNLKDRYKNCDISLIKAMIIGTLNSYYAMQISNFHSHIKKDLEKNSNKIFDHSEEFLANILLDALCED